MKIITIEAYCVVKYLIREINVLRARVYPLTSLNLYVISEMSSQTWLICTAYAIDVSDGGRYGGVVCWWNLVCHSLLRQIGRINRASFSVLLYWYFLCDCESVKI